MKKLILTLLLCIIFTLSSFTKKEDENLNYNLIKSDSISVDINFQNPEVIVTDERQLNLYKTLIEQDSILNQKVVDYLDLLTELQTEKVNIDCMTEERRSKESIMGSLSHISKQTKISETKLTKILNKKLLFNKIQIIIYALYAFSLIYVIGNTIIKDMKPAVLYMSSLRVITHAIFFYFVVHFADKLVNSDYYYIKELIKLNG